MDFRGYADIEIGVGPGRVAGYEFALLPWSVGGDGGRDSTMLSFGGMLGHKWHVVTGESDSILAPDLRIHWRLMEGIPVILSAMLQTNLIALWPDEPLAHKQHRLGAELSFYPLPKLFLRAGSTFYFGAGPFLTVDASTGFKWE